MSYMQVLEDRGGELRKAKERYRLVSLVATPPMMVGYRGGREVVGVEAVSMGQVLALYTRSTKCLEDTLLCGFVQPLIKAPVHLCILLGGARDAGEKQGGVVKPFFDSEAALCCLVWIGMAMHGNLSTKSEHCAFEDSHMPSVHSTNQATPFAASCCDISQEL